MNKEACIFLERGIDFEDSFVSDCCILHHDCRGLPKLIKDYSGDKIDWNQIFAIKEKRIEAQKVKTIYECENCYRLKSYTYEFTGEHKISEFHFSHCRICNAKCIYCSQEYNAGSLNYDTYEIIKNLKDEGFYAPGGEATFQGGEPTLMKNFDNLIKFFGENGTAVRIHTSGIRFSEIVGKSLSENKGTVVISLDSGTRATYYGIKQVNCFDIVCDSIKKYASASPDNVVVKYILVPGYNDNIKEIDAFFKLMQDLGIKNTAIDIEVQYATKYENKNVSQHLFYLTDYFLYSAERHGIKTLIYSFLSYVLENRKVRKSFLIKNKLLCSLIVKFTNNTKKNIDYLKKQKK